MHIMQTTWLLGFVKTTHDDIVQVFGEPDHVGNYCTDPEEPSVEWLLDFQDEDGNMHLFSIYSNANPGNLVGGVHEYRIGGDDSCALEYVMEAFKGAGKQVLVRPV